MSKILIDEATVKLVLKALGKVNTRAVIMGSTGDYREGQLDALSSVSQDVAPSITALREALADQPAQQELVVPGGGYVPAIPAQQRPIKTFHGGKAWPVQEPAQQCKWPTCQREEAQKDLPDLIAGYLGVSRGTAYDMMREALEKQSRQERWQKIECPICGDMAIATDIPPAQRNPLTADQIRGVYEECDAPTSGLFTIAFVRAIEAAHGIKENT